MHTQAELVLGSIRFAYEPGGWELQIPALSLGLEPLCGIVGPNGSGKSTLLKIAAGMLAAPEGRVTLNDHSLASMHRGVIARILGFLPQECPALFDYTVQQVAAMGRHAHGGVLELSTLGDAEAVARALDAVGLESLRHRPLSHLSGGERRRAWIASALAQEPDILLLDEPTQSLDLHQAVHIMKVLAGMAEKGMRVVAVLHDLNLASLFCDRLILLRQGQIFADGVPRDLLTQKQLSDVYGDNLEVMSHPETQQPLVWARK